MKTKIVKNIYNSNKYSILKNCFYFCKCRDENFYNVFSNNFITEDYILNNFQTEQTDSGVFLFDTIEDAQELLDYLEPFFVMEKLVN